MESTRTGAEWPLHQINLGFWSILVLLGWLASVELGYNFKTFEDDLIKPSFHFPNYQEWQTLSERTSQILCFQSLTVFTRKENELCRENLFTTFFSPRLEGFQPALPITHLRTLQTGDTYVTITRVTKYIAKILLISGWSTKVFLSAF